MDRWIDGCKSALKTLRGALNRGAFSLTLAACLAMVGGAAYYARNAGRTPTPAAPQPTIAPVVMTPSSVETLEDALARDTAPQPIWPLSGREQLTMHDEHAPQWSETLGIWTIHTGVDIAAAAGEAVLATLAGTVVRAERDAQLGNLIEIQHDDGHLSRYANLSTMLVTVGERVLQ
ncbi:M23 family metallopeptidase, partial [Eubacteriales bacterium OttesenSCG-928-N13]|nr:M23 family metallopeptidase [Eubacteriales bacterium OttesenSCG-928-N13]